MKYLLSAGIIILTMVSYTTYSQNANSATNEKEYSLLMKYKVNEYAIIKFRIDYKIQKPDYGQRDCKQQRENERSVQ